jgi:hypothetical protein
MDEERETLLRAEQRRLWQSWQKPFLMSVNFRTDRATSPGVSAALQVPQSRIELVDSSGEGLIDTTAIEAFMRPEVSLLPDRCQGSVSSVRIVFSPHRASSSDVLPLLVDEARRIRLLAVEAVEALSRKGLDATTREALEARISDTAEDVRRAAQRALSAKAQ